MKTFDYETAWHEQSRRQYEALPQNVRDLLAYTAEASNDLRQLSDCSMPWPDADSGYGDLRGRFDKIPAEILAEAAQTIYNLGHWYPGKSANGYPVPGKDHGATWKFSHYADQSLRARLGVRAANVPGVALQIHQGLIRLCYSSNHSWTWREIDLASVEGYARAQTKADALRARLAAFHSEHTRKRDQAAHEFMEPLTLSPSASKFDTARYMVEESVIALRRTKLTDWDAEKAKVNRDTDRKIAELDRKIAELATERAGKLWLLSHQIPTENAIYYAHTGRWCFGWYKPLDGEAHRYYVEQLGAEFPYEYDYKFVPGYDPSRVSA